MEKALVESLRTFDINEMEFSLYFLLDCGAETAGRLVGVTGMARAEVDKTLRGLLEKGMIEASAERPTRYSAVPIETALDAAVMKQAYHLRQMECSKQELVELVNREVMTRPNKPTSAVFR